MLKCDYKLNTACNRVSIEANACIQFEKSDDESIPIGTPALWDEALMLKIDIDKCRIYHICCIFVPNGMYSRITDYKKIWKLADIPPGFYDGAYTTDHGKMYFGITLGKGMDCFMADTSNLMILVPEGLDFDITSLFEVLRSERVECTDEKLHAILDRIVSQENGAFAFLYDYNTGGSLNIFGKNVEHFNLAGELEIWPTDDPALIYRRGLIDWIGR